MNARLVEIVERLKGPAHAFALYQKLGLPLAVAEPEPQELAAETRAYRAFAADPCVSACNFDPLRWGIGVQF